MAAGPPTTISPGSGSSPGLVVNSLTPTFNWNAASGATGYGLYIRDMTADGTPLIYPNANGVTVIPLTGTSLVFPRPLASGHIYRWNMTSFSGSTEGGAVSSVLYFQTPTAMATGTATPPVVTQPPPVIANPPTIIFPGGTASAGIVVSSLTPEFRWNSVAGATGYGLYIRDMTATGTPLVYPNASGIASKLVPVLDAGFGPTFLLPSGYLVNGHTYRWNMTSFTGPTESSGVSSVLYFQTQLPTAVVAPPPVTFANPPTIISPGGTASAVTTVGSLTPEFRWNYVAGATGYGLYIRDMTAAGTPLVYPNASGAASKLPNVLDIGFGPSFVVPSGYLVNGHTYRWNMTSFTGSTESSGVSSVLYFQTPPVVSTATTAMPSSGIPSGTVAATPITINAPAVTAQPTSTSGNPAGIIQPTQPVVSTIPTTPTTQPPAPGQPDFSSSHYTTANHFWKRGFSPASTSPPNPPGCQLGNALGNCTWYAYGRILELGYDSQQLAVIAPPGHGDAKNWANNARGNNILVDSNPSVWAIAQSDSQDHVAVVESINGSMITVSESAYVGNNPLPTSTWNFLWRRRTVSSTWFNNYIHVSNSSIANTTATSPSPVISKTAVSSQKAAVTFSQPISATPTMQSQTPDSPTMPIEALKRSGHRAERPVIQFNLTVRSVPPQGGGVSGGGTYASGSSQTVNATPNTGFVFERWTEDGKTLSLLASYNFNIYDNHHLTAHFKKSR